MNRKTISILALTLLTSACAGEQSSEGLVARVDEYTLTVDAAVDLLVDEERLAADAGVVEALAEQGWQRDAHLDTVSTIDSVAS